MTLDLKDYSSLQEELTRVKRQAQEQAVAQGIRMSALVAENKALRDALEFYAQGSPVIGFDRGNRAREALDAHWEMRRRRSKND